MRVTPKRGIRFARRQLDKAAARRRPAMVAERYAPASSAAGVVCPQYLDTTGFFNVIDVVALRRHKLGRGKAACP